MERKRRLSSGWSFKNKENELFFEPNDDEEERRQSKVINAEDIGNSTTPTNTSKVQDPNPTKRKKGNEAPKQPVDDIPSSSATGKSTAKLTNEQIVELYSNCIKLCTENKINAKNAWQLNFIDYMGDMLETQKEAGDNTNFQAASHTLDASVKIWGCRVDAIHTDTFKILGGLSRTEKRDGDEADEDKEAAEGKEEGEEQAKEETVEKKKKVKKAPVGGINTLETNLDNINTKNFDLEFMVDPLFRKTSAAFDEGGARGLLLNHLSVQNNGELIFDSNDAVDTAVRDEGNSDTLIDISELRDMLLATGGLENEEVCPTFSRFSFEKGSEKIPDIATGDESGGDDGPISDFEDDDNDNYAHEFPDFVDAELPDEGINHTMIERSFLGADTEQAVPDIAGHIADEAWADFQYFNPKIAKNWSGPEHWRFTPAPKASSSGTKEGGEGGTEAAAKKKGTKRKGEGFFVDFFGPPPDESLFAPPGRALTTLSAAALKKATEASTTLPPDVHYDIKMLTQLFSKPKWIIPPLSKRRKWNAEEQASKDKGGEDTEPEAEGAAGDDRDDFGGDDPFPFNADAGANSDEETGADHEPDHEGEAHQFGVGSSGFVDQPQRVQKVNINFAKVAKRIDVKALKSVIWSDLCGTPKNSKKAEETYNGSRDFSDLLSSVAERSQGQPDLQETSVAMSFICLLHLANEKGLSLVQNGIDTLSINSK